MTFNAFDPTHDEDGLPIVVREPRQSWKANLFWGLALGVPALVLPWVTGVAGEWFDKIVTTLIGAGWLGFMGLRAWNNFGRSVHCDMEWVTVRQAFRSHRFPLADVVGIEREDVRKSTRDFDNIGVSERDRRRQMDTMAKVVMVVLKDANGETLLRMDEDMEPPEAMARLMQRLRRATEDHRPEH